MYNYGLEEMLNFVANRDSCKILIWSACPKSDYALKFFRDNNIEIYGYIDKNSRDIGEWREYKVYDIEIIKREKFYIYIALENTYYDVLLF